MIIKPFLMLLIHIKQQIIKILIKNGYALVQSDDYL